MAEDLGRSYWSIRGRMTKLRHITGLDSLAELVYWGLTEDHIRYTPKGLPRLGDHELVVVEGIAVGKGATQLAEELKISPHTVERRISRARKRVGARSQAHLVAICYTEGWIF